MEVDCDYEIDNESTRQSFDQKNFINGICRKKVKEEFVYKYIKNNKEVTKKDIDRINKLRIPPAWINVWIANDPNETIQAIGIDNKGRKQYRYHEEHIKGAEKKKFLRLADFINSIPKLQKVILVDNKKDHYSKKAVISTMLKIVQAVHIRVGKECYAQANKSYGISSLKKTHAKIDNDKLTFNFKGKSNKRLTYTINDKHVIEHVKKLMKLQGEKLFQYIDDDDNIRRATDMDINKYIQKSMGPNFTCKDFRTYAANNYFIASILKETKNRLPKNNKTIKKNILLALKRTAYYLKHTKAISKKSYVMNFAIDLYQENPQFFIERINNDPDTVLIEIINLYKKKVLNI